jgi:hypothetical protein
MTNHPMSIDAGLSLHNQSDDHHHEETISK